MTQLGSPRLFGWLAEVRFGGWFYLVCIQRICVTPPSMPLFCVCMCVCLVLVVKCVSSGDTPKRPLFLVYGQSKEDGGHVVVVAVAVVVVVGHESLFRINRTFLSLSLSLLSLRMFVR